MSDAWIACSVAFGFIDVDPAGSKGESEEDTSGQVTGDQEADPAETAGFVELKTGNETQKVLTERGLFVQILLTL